MKKNKGFTLVELMVVILIVAILAAVSIPIMRGRIESAKWSEGAAIAGAVRVAAKVYYAEDPVAAAALAGSKLSDAPTRTALGFQTDDITGKYFTEANFTLTSYDDDASGNATIDVSTGTGLSGTGALSTANGWVYNP